MRAALAWLQARADNVAAALLAAMFVAFILQIVTRYVVQQPAELDAGGLRHDLAVAGVLGIGLLAHRTRPGAL